MGGDKRLLKTFSFYKIYVQTICFYFFKNYIIFPAAYKSKRLYLQVISCTEDKKRFDLNTKELQQHKTQTFIKICKYNISLNQ